MISLIILFLLVSGVAIYFLKPRYFFLYWLAIQPYVLPVFFILFTNSMLPIEDNYIPKLYFGNQNIMSELMLLLFCISYVKENNSKLLRGIFLPFLLLVSFLFIQNYNVGFRVGTLYANIITVLWIIAPFILLLIDKNIRPKRENLIKFIYCFVYIQLLFCVLNLVGFRIYGEVTGIFDDSLICGTFTRYNHMANYLAAFFLILSHEYFKNQGVSGKKYYLTALLIGLLIIMSGSRMTFLLYMFTAIYFFCVYHGKIITILLSIVIVMLFSTFVMGNNLFYGQNADEESGFMRNVVGLVNLANSEDLSQGSTLGLSLYLLVSKFDSPLMGNGRAFRKDFFYGYPTDIPNEGVYMTDARLAYMLVEYGILGLSLFFLLFISMLKVCYLYSYEHDKSLYVGIGIYFLLFSLTDGGFWDFFFFSFVFIYTFSIKNNKAPMRMSISI